MFRKKIQASFNGTERIKELYRLLKDFYKIHDHYGTAQFLTDITSLRLRKDLYALSNEFSKNITWIFDMVEIPDSDRDTWMEIHGRTDQLFNRFIELAQKPGR
jgi:hypothetical protein